ncbi:MAG: sugar ABC transporter ATP-binding protein [Planctomycetes bacterium]|nr:sugar ABC transporter ATP-binding protein [Planctomycetota bacterium]
MRSITKRFPGVLALDGVDFSMRRGEVHALMGENGAGKSTLIKVLTGVYPRDGGEIVFDGRRVAPRSPLEAQRLGISTIYQEVNLIPHLSVAENIFLGRQPGRSAWIGWPTMHRRAEELLAGFGLRLDVRRSLASYPLAIQQMAAVARAADISARLLIMDEPTSSLDPSEVARLFGIIRTLKARGISVLFITHFLDQAFEITDRMTVLRNGRRVGVFETASLSRIELIGHMLGKDPTAVAALEREKAAASASPPGKPFLDATGLGRKGSVEPFDLTVHEGEVLGLAGLLGSGRTETARLLFGADRATSGALRVGGIPAKLRSPRAAVTRGIGFCPEDRKSDGLLPDLSVRENIVLAVQRRLARLGIVSRARQLAVAEKFIKLLGIAVSGPEQPVRTLSGGNQQKVILARWLATSPRLLILDEPTRGIDVGAKAEVERLVADLARDGMAVIFISSELEEVVRRSHRVAVLRDRRKVAELAGDAVDEHAIMHAIAGTGENGTNLGPRAGPAPAGGGSGIATGVSPWNAA